MGTKRLHIAKLCVNGGLIAVATLIAASTRFEPLFLLATADIPSWQTACFAILTGLGAWVAIRTGLKLTLSKSSLIPAIASAAIVAVLIIALDGLIYRATLSPEYIASFSEPLGLRIAYYSARSLTEEILYRLAVMSSLFWLVQQFRNLVSPRSMYWALCCAILFAQLLNAIPKSPAIFSADLSGTIYLIARFVVPGLVWGYLFWRYSFATATLAHISCHVILQPALGYILQS